MAWACLEVEMVWCIDPDYFVFVDLTKEKKLLSVSAVISTSRPESPQRYVYRSRRSSVIKIVRGFRVHSFIRLLLHKTLGARPTARRFLSEVVLGGCSGFTVTPGVKQSSVTTLVVQQT